MVIESVSMKQFGSQAVIKVEEKKNEQTKFKFMPLLTGMGILKYEGRFFSTSDWS